MRDAGRCGVRGARAGCADKPKDLAVKIGQQFSTRVDLLSKEYLQELEKLHRVVGKKLVGAPHEVLLVLDATTGMNALTQAREFNKAVPLSGLVITKLDGTSRGGMIVSIQEELKIPVKYVGVGEQADDLQPFQAKEFAEALFSE